MSITPYEYKDLATESNNSFPNLINIMKNILLLFILLWSITVSAQSLDEINERRFRHSMNGSIALTSWAGANIVSGAIGMATTTGEWKHFHEMNVIWNVVNLGLGVPGLFSKKKKEMGLSLEKTVKKTTTTKIIYLANGVLDVAYITTGFLFREIGLRNSQNTVKRDRFMGFGNSIIMQGGFLLIFDFVQFGLHTINGKRIDKHWKKISVRPYGLGMHLSVCLNTPKIEIGHAFAPKPLY